MELEQLGWSAFFQQQTIDSPQNLHPARISRQDLGNYHLVAEAGELTGVLPGRFHHESAARAELPTVGDWVLVELLTEEPGKAVIREVLERRSKFSRKEAWQRTEEQIVAANIDTVFIVSSLDHDFNTERLNRYLVLGWDSGATPVIVLSKADICTDVEDKLDQLHAVAMGASIHVISALTNDGMEALSGYLVSGQTVALMGSSGVGKSTIINTLAGEQLLDTGEVRDDDSKGRHTTTYRQLVCLERGGVLIDTPGMRELQLWADESTLAESFDDIESVASECRFSDCLHQDEPGCAVSDAISSGGLEQERLDSYRKLQRELTWLAEKQDVVAQSARKQERKRFGRMMKKRPTKRDY
jgi:ribosome biogenesis GTPase / thiamine phosphate phosphatase